MNDVRALPEEPKREGGRWRYHRPSSDQVADWFKTVPLDEGMAHEDFVNGIVVIPATEKVKKQVEKNGVLGTVEQYEMTYTPYVRVDTRITYFRKLAEANGHVAVIEPVSVPRFAAGDAANDNMPEGFWWYIAPRDGGATRFLCCTMRVALYREQDWFGAQENNVGGRVQGTPRALREGVATKQVAVAGQYGADINALAKAETGAIGRALGIAGILVVGTGIATAEDLAEVARDATQISAELPEAAQAPETPEQLGQRILGLQSQLQARNPEAWSEIAAWWQERMTAEGWAKLEDAPIEVRRGLATRIANRLEQAASQANQDSSPEAQTATS